MARRLSLRLPATRQLGLGDEQFSRELGALTGSESVRSALQQDRLLDQTDLAQPMDQPMPEDIQPPLAEVAEPPADVPIEPIVMHVPEECFYVRFGSFANFLWFQDMLTTWGGDLQNLVASRGLDDGRSARIQKLLVLKQSQLSRLLGGTVIADVAMLGTDLLLGDGPAVGFLFEARNNLLLSNDFRTQRADCVKSKAATEEKLQIEGQEVSLLSSSDGAVRSYYATRGDYHFVTSSKVLVTRFLQTVHGHSSLGASREFRRARMLMPIAREDTVFAYFSSAFFRNLTSPHYRIEMLRRLQAASDIELVIMARLQAAAEGHPSNAIDRLIGAGVLPMGFGPRPDGSQAVVAGSDVYDSLRGRRGSFIPVPDVPVTGVSRSEDASYRHFANFYREQWGTLEPMLFAVKRQSMGGNREQVVIDARMTPLSRKRVEMLQRFSGQADKTRLAPVPGDMAAFDMVLPQQRLFGALRDVTPPTTNVIEPGILSWLGLGRVVQGYLGNVGDPGFLGILNATFTTAPDANGYSRSLLNLWRLNYGQYTLYSFQGNVLPVVAPQLRFEEAQRLAQLRVRIQDLGGAQITPLLNDWGYVRTRQTSLGNLRLLHLLEQQFHLPAKDCLDAAQQILGAKVICPLGGQYVLRQAEGGSVSWTSTSLEQAGPQSGASPLVPKAPPGYTAPPLNWFRGLDLDAAVLENVLSAHAEVLMQMPNGAK